MFCCKEKVQIVQGMIKAFVEKLQLWINGVKNNNFVQFPCVNVMLGDKQNIWVHVIIIFQSWRMNCNSTFQRWP